MALPQFAQEVLDVCASRPRPDAANVDQPRYPKRTSTIWMVLDAITVTIAATVATTFELHIGLFAGIKGFVKGTLIQGRSMGILLAILCGFIVSLIFISRRMHLYTPLRVNGFLHEFGLTLQACFVSASLLIGGLYLFHASDIPPSIVLITLGLVAVSLSVRRAIYRFVTYSRFQKGIGTRQVLIVGTGQEAHALRRHLDSIRHLGYSFKGYISLPGATNPSSKLDEDVVGTLDTLFQCARKRFVDEIFITFPCDLSVLSEIRERAHVQGIDLRVVPDLYGGLAWNMPIEYIGQFPTIPLLCDPVPELELMLKRVMDVFIAFFVLVVLFPLLLGIGIAIKWDTPGPALYFSERIGKKGRVFRCIKFRTMAPDAEKRRGEVLERNERDGILFKMTNDPRVTPLGRILRKYSLDELPQFVNVLRGDMSVVGPRPPIASEVRKYELTHLARLDVLPGITGLWQVQGRQDPSFANYICLDLTYIENWSIWLDIKIILRTVGVMLAGTGS